MKERKGGRELRPEEKLDKIARPISEKTLSMMRNFIKEVSLPERSTSLDLAAKILRQLRVLGMDKGDLAEKLGVTQACVTRYVSGKCNFTLRTLVQIEEALGINIIDREITPKQKNLPTVIISLPSGRQNLGDYPNMYEEAPAATVAEPEPLYARSTQKQYAKMA